MPGNTAEVSSNMVGQARAFRFAHNDLADLQAQLGNVPSPEMYMFAF